jgi:hypothetical protein
LARHLLNKPDKPEPIKITRELIYSLRYESERLKLEEEEKEED